VNSNDVSPIWYWLVFLIYIAFVGYLGYRAYKQQKGMQNATDEHHDFWITGRKQPAYMVAMSIASGWMLIGMITWMTWSTYDLGMSGLWIAAIPWVIGMLFNFWLVRLIRKMKAISQCQMLEQRFGLPARVYSAVINIASYTIWSAAELFAAALIMAPALHISVAAMIFIYALPIACYMWLGGFRSVINANVVQFFMGAILFVTVAICMYFTASDICSSHGTTIWGALQHQNVINSWAYPYDSSKSAMTLYGYIGPSFIIAILVALLPGWTIGEDWWLKAQAAKTTPEATKGLAWMLIYNLSLIVIPASLMGLFGIIIFKPEMVKGALTAASVLGDKGGYNVISVYINNYMSPWVKALMIFLLSAHSMSTVANYSNISAMNLSWDVLQPTYYKKHNWSQEKIVKYARFAMVVIIALNIALALLYTIPSLGATLNDWYFMSSAWLTAGVAIMLYAMFWKRANLRGVMLGGVLGLFSGIVFYILEYHVWNFSYNTPIWDWIFGKGALASTYLGYCVVGLFFAIVGLIVGTYTGPKPTQEKLDSIAEHVIDDNEAFFKGASM